MPSQFICEPIKNERRPGVLESVGVRWTEGAMQRQGIERATRMVGLVGLVFLMLIGLLLVASGALAMIGFVVLVIFGPILLLAIKILFGNLQERTLIFEQSGQISAPNGIPGKKQLRTLDIGVGDVSRIEQGPPFGGIGTARTVQITTLAGKTITIGQGLLPEEARDISVNLTLALKALRENTQTETAPKPINPFEPSPVAAKGDSDLID